jgi:ZIP family zinc transporter
MGLPLTIGITAHNMAEGAAVSVSVFVATKSKAKALLVASLSGLTEPLSVLVGYFLFLDFITPSFIAISLACIAGIMVALVLFELLPLSQKSPSAQYWVLFGMLFTAVPLFVLAD